MQNLTKAYAVLAAVFLAGLLLGVSSATVYLTQMTPRPASFGPGHPPAGPPRHGPPRPEMAAKHMAMQLQLSPEQTETARKIFTSLADEVERVHRESKARMDGILEEVARRLAPHLTEEQRTELTRLVAEIKEFGPPRGPGRGHPPRPE